MSKKIMIIGLTLLMLMSGLTGCEKKEEKKIPVKGGVVQNNEENAAQGDKKGDSAVEKENKGTSNSKDDAIPLKKENIKKLNDTIRSTFGDRDINVTVKSVEISKQFKGEDVTGYTTMILDAWRVERDESENIKDEDEWSYIWMEIEWEGIGDSSYGSMMQYPIYSMDKDGFLSFTDGDCCYMDGVPYDPKDKRNSWITLKKGEKKTFLLGHVIQDQYLNKTLGYYISADVTPEYPGDESYFVKLN